MSVNSKRIFILAAMAVLVLTLPNFFVFAQEECQTQEECEALLKKYEEQISKYEKDMEGVQKEKKTLQNQIGLLQSKIKKLNLQISQGNLMIKDIGIQIQGTEKEIKITSDKISETRLTLKESLRILYKESKKGNIEILLGSEQMSDFFTHLANLETLNSKINGSLTNIESLKISLEKEKGNLDREKENTEKVAKIQALQKQESEAIKRDQEYFLKLTEIQYQQYLKEKKDVEKQAAEIRAKLFRLIGVAKAPTFGEALVVAKNVAAIVNIRPALLLAIISQESAIGRNVGQCVLTDPITGSGKKISTGLPVSKLMKPTRDVQLFLKITAALGKDPYNTPVSCPWISGWGGAMGPAQFIPSTWNLYFDKLQSVLGRSGDPWAITDSFTAAGLYLSDLGASAKTAAKEASAACRYYGGCSDYNYGESVMRRATCIQNFIDLGTMSFYCESLIF